MFLACSSSLAQIHAVAREYDCIVIGAGPGGLVAALYLRRLGRKVLLIGTGDPRASRIPKIRNLVGYDEGISGRALLRRLHRQYSKYGGKRAAGRAIVRREGRAFKISLGRRIFRAHKVILATGMRDIEPPLKNLRALTRAGLFGYCPICDGFDHRGKRIALLVRDMAGCKKISFMSAFSQDLSLITMEAVKIPPRFAATLRRRSIPIFAGPPSSVRKNPRARSLIFRFKDGATFEADAAYVMMGVTVPDEAFAKMRGLKRSAAGFLLVNAHQETSVPGLYAVGDCVNALSQVSVAVGQAAIAAADVHNCLRD